MYKELIRRISIFTVCFLTVSSLAVAQTNGGKKQQQDEFEMDAGQDYEAAPYFGLGLGVQAMVQMPNLSGINAQLSPLGVPAFNTNIVPLDFSAFVSVPFVPNFRIGFLFPISGKTTTCGDVLDTSITPADSVKRTAVFSENFYALTGEYVFPLRFTGNKVVLVGGLMLGGGTMSLEFDQTSSQPRTYAGFYDPSSTVNFTRQIHSSFFEYQPYINVEYSILSFLMLRVGVGYNGTIVGTWTADNDIGISGVPSISGNSISYNASLFLGVFR